MLPKDFLRIFQSESCLNVLGDINQDGSVNILDVIVLVNYILDSESSQSDLLDINSDGNINILDVIQLVNIILNQ